MCHHDQPYLSFKRGTTECLKVRLEDVCIFARFDYRARSWPFSWGGLRRRMRCNKDAESVWPFLKECTRGRHLKPPSWRARSLSSLLAVPYTAQLSCLRFSKNRLQTRASLMHSLTAHEAQGMSPDSTLKAKYVSLLGGVLPVPWQDGVQSTIKYHHINLSPGFIVTNKS